MPPRLLLVEDQPTVAAAIAQLLAGRGLAIEQAGDGIAALRRILDSPPDLVLLDLNLPGLHGIELLRKLRATPKYAGLPVIAMSGVYKGERYSRALQELGVAAFLEKPFSAQQLHAALERIPALRPAAAPPAPAAPAPLDRHLIRAFLQRNTGELVLRGEDGTHLSLIVLNGTPVALRPGVVLHNFGAYLLHEGLVSPGEYDHFARSGGEQHELFVEMGALPHRELGEQQCAYLAGELLAAMARPPLAAEFRPLTAPPGWPLATLNLPELVHQGHRSLFTPQRAAGYLERLREAYAAATPAYYRLINRLTLSAAEQGLLRRLDGSRTVATALAGEQEALPLLYTLQAFGMIRLDSAPAAPAAPPPWLLRPLFGAAEASEAEPERMESFADLLDPGRSDEAEPAAADAVQAAAAPSDLGERVRATHAALQGKDYYERFGLSQGSFSFAKLKESYFAITREFGPDLLMQLGGEEANQAEAILALVAEAYETLADVVKKEKYDQLLGADKIGLGQQGDERFRAQVQAQSGKVFIEMEEWDNAEKALKDACAIEPENGDFLAHLAWAIYCNPRYAASRPTLERARQMLNRAVTLERSPAAYAFKGTLLLDANQEALAEAEFNKALKLDARNALARKGLRRIQEKREQEKKGLFGRMFGGKPS